MIFHSFVKLLTNNVRTVRLVSLKSLSTKTLPFTVDKNALAQLRKQTGIGFSNCRKALEKHGNNFEEALAWLNQQAEKEGWSKAIQLKNRPMSQGVLGVITNHTCGVQLEVNCETDFVARNSQFLALVAKIGNECFSLAENSKVGIVEFNSEQLGSLQTSSGERVADMVAAGIGNIKENILARRAVFVKLSDCHQHLTSYVHSAGCNKDYLEINNCRFGKYASLVVIQSESPDIKTLGTKLGQHIVGMKPQTIGDPNRQLAQEEEQKEVEDAQKKISSEEESELLHQEFLLDPDVTVKEWLDENNMQVKQFVRFAVGEELNQGSLESSEK